MAITLKDYAMGREEIAPDEWANAKQNAERLLNAVNGFLSEVFPGRTFGVSSGFRPAKINSGIKGAAKKSMHMTGLAIDLKDSDKFLKNNLNPEKNPAQAEALRKYGLFMESRLDTPNWCHLDLGNRKDRPSRTFRA